jgi:hypothetical protein
MANAVTIQTIIDGPRNAVVKITGILDTSDVAPVQVAVPATMFHVAQTLPFPLLKLDYIDYSMGGNLEVILSWGLAGGAGPGAPILPIAARGRMAFDCFGGLTNNQAGSDGSIWLQTTGWAATPDAVTVFTVVLELIKTGGIGVGVR